MREDQRVSALLSLAPLQTTAARRAPEKVFGLMDMRENLESFLPILSDLLDGAAPYWHLRHRRCTLRHAIDKSARLVCSEGSCIADTASSLKRRNVGPSV